MYIDSNQTRYPIAVHSTNLKTKPTVNSHNDSIYKSSYHNGTHGFAKKSKVISNFSYSNKLLKFQKKKIGFPFPQLSRKRTRHLKPHRSPKNYRACVKCPKEIILTAHQELDGVLVETPAPLSCKTNLPFSHNLFRIETLFGPDFGPFVLPRGRHSIVGKIRNVETGLVERSCLLKYNVIVPRCEGLPKVTNIKLKMVCTAHNVWGSKCAFSCKNHDEYVSHHEPLVCNEDLEWVGHEPHCVLNDIGKNGFSNLFMKLKKSIFFRPFFAHRFCIVANN